MLLDELDSVDDEELSVDVLLLLLELLEDSDELDEVSSQCKIVSGPDCHCPDAIESPVENGRIVGLPETPARASVSLA